jgi:3-hydroxybutyryl-CoA dehydrogenase
MNLDDVTTIGVVGAGQMGAGIAQVAAVSGYDVVLRDLKEEIVEQGLETIEGSLSRFAAKDQISDDEVEAALDRIETTTELADFTEADVVVEAIVEDEDAKTSVFKDLDRITHEDAILASNTSSIPITRLGAPTDRADQVIGMHFFNPVPLMGLVEVIRGHDTSDATTELVLGLARDLGKSPVEVEDLPGFASNRILMPMLNEAMFALHEGVADTEAIDQVMRMGMNHPMGPLELADYVGLDTCLHVVEVLHEGFGDSKYRPAPILKQKVDAGHLGRKTGKGFYVCPFRARQSTGSTASPSSQT